jgi:hypothetical protein
LKSKESQPSSRMRLLNTCVSRGKSPPVPSIKLELPSTNTALSPNHAYENGTLHHSTPAIWPPGKEAHTNSFRRTIVERA